MLFFFKQKTAYEMRISDWSSDVCSSDLRFQQFAAIGLVGFICARVSEDPADLTSPDRFKLCVLFGGPAIEHIQCFVAHAFIDRWEVHRRYEANFLVAPSPKRQFETSAHAFSTWDFGISGMCENEGPFVLGIADQLQVMVIEKGDGKNVG